MPVELPLQPEPVRRLFGYARERYEIFLGKETEDPVLRDYRFCNVFREDDRTTIWFRENMREPVRDNPEAALISAVAFRFTNRIDMGEALRHPEIGLQEGRFDPEAAKRIILEAKPKGPYTNAAYIVKTPNQMNKLDGVLWIINNITPYVPGIVNRLRIGLPSLKTTQDILVEFPYVGAFMAYEVVTDLRHTCLLENADDIMRWANPGPGAMRGLCRLAGLDANALSRNNADHVTWAMHAMRTLLALSQKEDVFWPADWPQWEMREVEHTLCEYDKWERAHSGEGRPKQKYYPNIKGE